MAERKRYGVFIGDCSIEAYVDPRGTGAKNVFSLGPSRRANLRLMKGVMKWFWSLPGTKRGGAWFDTGAPKRTCVWPYTQAIARQLVNDPVAACRALAPTEAVQVPIALPVDWVQLVEEWCGGTVHHHGDAVAVVNVDLQYPGTLAWIKIAKKKNVIVVMGSGATTVGSTKPKHATMHHHMHKPSGQMHWEPIRGLNVPDFWGAVPEWWRAALQLYQRQQRLDRGDDRLEASSRHQIVKAADKANLRPRPGPKAKERLKSFREKLVRANFKPTRNFRPHDMHKLRDVLAGGEPGKHILDMFESDNGRYLLASMVRIAWAEREG